MYAYDTLSEAVNGLKQRGYNIDFNIEADKLVCNQTPVSLSPDEFEIAEVYRFEGNTDPADEAVLYAIESKHGHKGLLVNGYGPGADPVGDALVKKLKERH
ncbi:MAG: phosphoribosylpyrophosphate synthetase [Chitinophagaceae bacterium]